MDEHSTSEPEQPDNDRPARGKKLSRLKRHVASNKRAYMIGSVVVLVAALALGGALWWTFRHHKQVNVTTDTSKTQTPKQPGPQLVADPLTGVMVPPSQATNPVSAVMIENLDPYARPQSGLGQAGVVYEALAEGGITRFMAIFQEPFPSIIGPVRSLRPYYLDWGLEYNIPVAHAGGSQPALAEVGPMGMKDINALIYDGSYFYRTRDRFAPHNLYTNASLLTQLLQKLGFATPPGFAPLARKADSPQSPPTHPTINIQFSYAQYNVQYRFDAASDSYARFMAGAPHVDRNTGQQIMVKNIVVEYVPTSYGTQDNGEPETIMNLVGQGKALVFEDGGVISATWSKAGYHSQTQILDASGQPVKFNRGNTWYEIIPTGNSVTY